MRSILPNPWEIDPVGHLIRVLVPSAIKAFRRPRSADGEITSEPSAFLPCEEKTGKNNKVRCQ